MRPVQCLLIGGTYHFAGLDPLAYHVVNTGALILGALLLLLVLRELGVPRPLRIAVPLLYAMLPHYATDRFWIAAIQATASAPLFFLTVYAELRAVRAGRARVGWWALAAAARTACALAYEVFIPLLFLSPLLAWLHARRQGPAAGPRLRSVAGLLALGALTVVTLAPALAWKASVTNPCIVASNPLFVKRLNS